MDELLSIVRAAKALRDRREAFLVATVVRVEGSSYRRAGARMILTEAVWLAGSVSGGCLEGDIAKRGWWRTRAAPVVVSYEGRSDDDARSRLGLGCDGSVDILLERFDGSEPCDPIELAARTLDDEKPRALATVFRSERADVPIGSRLAIDGDGAMTSTFDDAAVAADLEAAARHAMATCAPALCTTSDGTIEALAEAIVPPPCLFVFGTGHDAVPVVTLAKSLGWRVDVLDHQARFSTRERFTIADRRVVVTPCAIAREIDARARALVVVMSHDYAMDRAALQGLLDSRAYYIGMLGPRRRTERMIEEIRRDGAVVTDRDRARIHAPIGLDVGAETPAEIALAIIAEAQASIHGASGGRMRERRGAIHPRLVDVSHFALDASAE